MADPSIKAQLESAFLTNNPRPVQALLDACLARDSGHIRFGAKNGAVSMIQEALGPVGDFVGVVLPAIRDPQGTFGADTRKAVFAFKSALGIQRTGQPLDDVVGRMTITALDDVLVQLQNVSPTPPPAQRFQDVVVQILGFGGPRGLAEGRQQGDGVLRQLVVSETYKKKTNRNVTTIVFTGGQNPDPTEEIAKQVRTAIVASGAFPGRICMFGASAGGKNVLRLASELNIGFLPMAIDYVGVSDGAFFDADATQSPAVFSNVDLVIAVRRPFTARVKNNIFQSAGNDTKFSVSLTREIWFGKMQNGEVHGAIEGFQLNRDLTSEHIIVDPGQGTNFETLHANAAGIADDFHISQIRLILDGAP